MSAELAPVVSDEMMVRLARMGFRRWYERLLIESHLWLAGCFVCMIVVASGIELMADRHGAGKFLLDVLLILAGVVMAWVSWRRYARTMVAAEAIGGQAVCGHCKHYGFRLVPSGHPQSATARCPKCAHQWLLQR